MRPALLLAALALAGPVRAHPGGFRVAAHDLDVRVSATHVELSLYLEVPRLDHRHEGAPPPAREVVPDVAELLSGLRVTADGAPLELDAGPPTYRSSRTMAGIGAVFTARRPEAAAEIVVENGNYPDLPGLFSTSWSVGPGVVVTGCSRHEPSEGPVRRDRNGAWWPVESARREWIRVAPAPRWASWWVPSDGSMRGSAAAVAPSLAQAAAARQPHPTLGAAASALALAAAALGAPRGAGGRWRAPAAVGGAVLGGALLTALGGGALADAFLAVGCALIALRAPGWAGVGLAALAGSTLALGETPSPALLATAPLAAVVAALAPSQSGWRLELGRTAAVIAALALASRAAGLAAHGSNALG